MAKSIVILGLVVAAAVLAGTMAAPRNKRVTEDVEAKPQEPTNSTAAVIICNKVTSCGWTVYTPLSKQFEYFMSNNYCECAPDLVCSYYDDDVSIGAFVHRCQKPLPTTTTAASETEGEAY